MTSLQFSLRGSSYIKQLFDNRALLPVSKDFFTGDSDFFEFNISLNCDGVRINGKRSDFCKKLIAVGKKKHVAVVCLLFSFFDFFSVTTTLPHFWMILILIKTITFNMMFPF